VWSVAGKTEEGLVHFGQGAAAIRPNNRWGTRAQEAHTSVTFRVGVGCGCQWWAPVDFGSPRGCVGGACAWPALAARARARSWWVTGRVPCKGPLSGMSWSVPGQFRGRSSIQRGSHNPETEAYTRTEPFTHARPGTHLHT
jgi:hypothetical protein